MIKLPGFPTKEKPAAVFIRVSWIIILLMLLPLRAFSQDQPEVPAIQAPEAKVETVTEKKPEGSPVTVNNTVLFYFTSDYGPFTAEERAAILGDKLTRILNTEKPDAELLKTEGDGMESRFFYGDQILFVLTAADVRDSGKSRYSVEKEYLKLLKDLLSRKKAALDLNSILSGLLYSAIATLILAALWKAVLWLFILWEGLVKRLYEKYIPDLKLQRLEILSSEKIRDILLAVSRLVKYLVLAGLVYIYLPFIFSFFPWTRNLAETIFHYTWTPVKKIGIAFFGFIPDMFVIVVIIIITRYIIQLIHMVFTEVGRGRVRFPGFYPDWAEPTYKIIRFLITAFAAIVIFPYIPGSSSPAFQGVSIFFGVLFSLGSTTAISNVIAGVVLTYMRPFKVGDRVKIADTTGDVVEKTLLVTRIRTIKNVDVTIPNSNILGTHMVNYSSSAEQPGLVLHTTVTIGYDADWRLVHKLLLEAAAEVDDIEKDTPPFVLQTSLDDWYVSYELNAYTEKPNSMAVTYSRLHEAIQDKFHAAGVEIMSPHFLGLRDGNRANIPEKYLGKDYEAPPFMVSRKENGKPAKKRKI